MTTWSREDVRKLVGAGVAIERKPHVQAACAAVARWKGWTIEIGTRRPDHELEAAARAAVADIPDADISALAASPGKDPAWEEILKLARARGADDLVAKQRSDGADRMQRLGNDGPEEEEEDGPHP